MRDTHAAVEELRAAGADDKLAAAVVRVIDAAVQETAATKSDLNDLEVRILRHLWIVAGAIVALVKLLP